jgi:TolB-like protein
MPGGDADASAETIARYSAPFMQKNSGDPPVVRLHWPSRIGWIATTVCLTVIALVGLLAWHALRSPSNIGQPRLSLVVLPFQNLSGNPAEDYLADGITDGLTSDLSLIPDAFVIARESAYTYKGKATDVRQIGRELGVRYVLEGSVRKLGTTLRVNAQLVSAESLVTADRSIRAFGGVAQVWAG